MSKPFAKWEALPENHYVDCETLRQAQIAQSAATKNGNVAPFQLPEPSSEPEEPQT